MPSEALKTFDGEVYKVELLDFALTYVRKNKTGLEAWFNRTPAALRRWPVTTFKEFEEGLLDAVTVGSVALFSRALARYQREIFGDREDVSTMVTRCPEYVVRCHRDHQPTHVLTILKEVRDRELHGRHAYNTLACDREPDEITLQRVHVRELDDRRLLLLCHDLDFKQQLAWRETLPVANRMEDIAETLGEFLVEEAIQCVRRFDALSTNTGALRKGKELPLPKPIEYPPLL